MLVVLTHSLYILIRGRTSSSWDTVTGLLALALQSPVFESLRGSGAGMERLGTYRQMAQLRAIRDSKGEREGVGERLVLVPEEADNAEVTGKPERCYDTSHSLKQNLISITAVAMSSMGSSLTQRRSSEEKTSNAESRKIAVDEKYL